MSIIGSNILAGAAGSGVSAYEIEQSLRFNSADSAYLNRTPGSAGNRKTWTWSGWLKLGTLGQQRSFFAGDTGNSDAGFTSLEVRNDNKLWVSGYNTTWRTSTQLLRDPSAWYHIIVVWDTTQATANDRIKVYINGSQITDFDTTNNPSQDATGGVNGAAVHYISTYDGSNWEWDGYLAEVNFIDGSALDHEDFGEFDDNGVWRPIKYAGSYTGNSFYLKFANGDGTDDSGLSNTWTANNFTTSGTGTDVMSDTPTTNWCTWNPLKIGTSTTLSEGNLYFIYPGAAGVHKLVTSTFAVSSGKWYWEGTYNAGGTAGSSGFGIAKDPINLEDSVGQANVYAYHSNGNKYLNNVGSSYGATYTTNDIIGIAFDADNGTLTGYKNGTSQGTMATGLTSGPYFLVGNSYNSSSWTLNAGQRAFAYTPPTGFKALNTANLPAPDIADGSEYFNTVLWTGDGSGSSRTISGVGFQPGFVWTKSRTETWQHLLYDSVRGAGNESELASSSTGVEGGVNANLYGYLSAFTSDGMTFTSGTDGTADQRGYYNKASQTYVAWNWLAGGSVSSNTDGTITSSVSANPSAGFSIVTYTGTGANATIGHGLGVAPKMIIFKNRDEVSHWDTYHASIGATKRLQLSSTIAASTVSTPFNDTEPTSTVFSVGTNLHTNGSGDTFVAYCFAEVEGYSKFGSYTGNGSSDGPFVYTGFRIGWLLVKRSDSTANWFVYDNKRLGYNQDNRYLRPDVSDAEGSGDNYPDMLSNGFKPRVGSQSINVSGATYIFMALASNPFGGSGVSPACAR